MRFYGVGKVRIEMSGRDDKGSGRCGDEGKGRERVK